MGEQGIRAFLLCAVSMLCQYAHSENHVRRTDVVDNSGSEYETGLGDADFARASTMKTVNLTELNIEVILDPTQGKRTEGDIVHSSSTLIDVARDPALIGKAAITLSYRMWPNRRIPYALSSYYGTYSRGIIAQVIAEYHAKTCVLFEPKTDDDFDYVFITPLDGCYSSIGRVGGKQDLSLAEGCIQFGTIAHELMHSTGFFHEQSRPDRDDYISIQYQNIFPSERDQFRKYDTDMIDTLGEPYDYGSIMHYGPTAFSSNGQPTIVAKQSGGEKMGQRDGFSDFDLNKINKHYDCNVNGHGELITTTEAVSVSPTTRSSRISFPESTPMTGLSTVGGECVDASWKCPYWMLRDAKAYCESDENVRQRDCRKSCGTCGGSTTVPSSTTPASQNQNCYDEFNSNICEKWASIGHCADTFSDYVRANCKLSCNAC
uniref:Metalloendopeptidase n=1 Tax=Plectus sambesii TaxID=2011161 RepID=A0A914W3V2_9BILA